MKIIELIVSILIAQSAGFIGAFFTTPNITSWYELLNKPSWTPPNWLFGPVWIFLYLLMGISAYLVWRERQNAPFVKTALLVYAAQLVLNVLWSVIFFGYHFIGLACVDISLLWLGILLTMVLFWRIAPLAGILFIPYLAWVSLAAALNLSIWRHNI